MSRTLPAFAAALTAIALSAVDASSSFAGPSDTGSWCAAVIRVNTQYGTMRNKHFLAPSQKVLLGYRGVVKAALAQRAKFLAAAPAEIKTAVSHELAYFARLAANNFTPLASSAPMTAADVHDLVAFQKTHCGITFS